MPCDRSGDLQWCAGDIFFCCAGPWPCWCRVVLANEGTPSKVDAAKGNVSTYYSIAALRRDEEGDVVVRLQINEEGKPTGRTSIAKLSGYDDLDMPALQSVMNSSYFPARPADGSPTAGWNLFKGTCHLPKAVDGTSD